MVDRREQKTRKLIQNSFFELAKEKDISKITVTELCEFANISRSTFYSHYEDYPLFLTEMENQLVDGYFQIHANYQYDTDTHELVNNALDYFFENNDKLFLLFREDSNGAGIKRICTKIKESTIPVWLKESNVQLEQVEIIFAYFINGVFAILEYYYHHPETDKHMLTDLIENLVKYGVYNYIYTK